MTRYIYDNGLPFGDPLKKAIDQQTERINDRRASLIVIDGAVGTGKTTLAVQIMDYINKINGKEPVSLAIKDHPQLALGGKEFTGNFRACHKLGLPVITYDEAGDFSRRGAITGFNMMINRLFETYRGFKIIVIVCLPSVNVLDSQIFTNQIPRLLLHIPSRNNHQAEIYAYSLSQMNWIRDKFDSLPKGAKHKCYNYVITNFKTHALNLEPGREKKLDKLSTYGKKALLKNTEIEIKGIVDYVQIAREINKSVLVTKRLVKKLQIKHKTIIDKKKYFEKGVISQLIENIREKKIEGVNNAD